MTSRHIYVDETKQRTYALVASVHVAEDIPGIRDVVRGLLLPRQRYLHMKDEREGRKAPSLVQSSMPAYRQPSIKPGHTTKPTMTAELRACRPWSTTSPMAPQRC